MSQSGPGRREVAYRLFAAEFDDSDLSYSESDEERAPNYVVTPTGARVNRLFAVGVLTEVEDVNPEMVRGRIVDPTGAFVTYAGQYQPDALAFLERVDPPAFLALSGKARTYEPEDGDRIYTSVRPESVSEVDAETRDRWIVTAAERTVERVEIMASAIESGLSGDALRVALSDAGVDDRLAEGVSLALEYYGTTPAYLDALRELAIDAAEVMAGERDEVRRLELSPGEGDGDASALATIDLSSAGGATGGESTTEDADTEEGAVSKGEAEEMIGGDSETSLSVESEPEPTPSAAIESEVAKEGGQESESEAESEATEMAGSSDKTDEMNVSEDTDSESTAASETPTEDAISEADVASVEEELDDFDPGEFELDEEERREVEEEFGTEFSTAGEVESPESGSEQGTETEAVNDSEPEAMSTADSGTEAAVESEPETESDAESEQAVESESESDAVEGEIDLTDAVMAAMEQLDEGDGADKDTLVETVVDEQGVSAEAVEEAIQDALMSGQCYEPADGTLKSI